MAISLVDQGRCLCAIGVGDIASAHPPSDGRLPHLDMIRGLAALEVCLGHLRGFFLVDYGQTQGGLAAKLFYTLTGMHHQAVMIFFVLSGFLVGGSVIRAHQAAIAGPGAAIVCGGLAACGS